MATGRLPDPNTAPLTAKGDLYTYSTAPARLAVGSDGETLVADSSTSTGLRWQGNFAAGKNKIINGDFGIWQRGTSITLPSSFAYTYTADRFECFSISAGASVSRQSFTPGTAPVAGYEGQFFLRYVNPDTSVGHIVRQKIEDVRTFAGQTITVSFWAKAASNLSFTGYNTIVQNFGSGGSGDVNAALSVSPSTITTSWQRFTATVSVPSVSGKTIGAGSFLIIQIGAAGNNTLDIWGIQAEAGNTATAFQTATGTLAGELAACQRYYWRGGNAATGIFNGGSTARYSLAFPVTMRVAPTITAIAAPQVMNPTVAESQTGSQTTNFQATATGGLVSTTAASKIQFGGFSSGTDGRPSTLLNDALEFSSEL